MPSWNMSNPLYRWKLKHGKLNKKANANVSIRKVKRRKTSMAKISRRRSPRRWFAKRYRKHAGHTIGIARTLAAVNYPLQVFTRQGGSGQPIFEFQSGNWQGAANALKDNVMWSLTTGEGLIQTIAPIIVTSVASKFFNRKIVKVGKWSFYAL